MPKAFDAIERASISAALAKVGLRHFERHGVRAARIEDICRDIGIAKGSFYAFHPSKEALFMAIAAEREALHRRDMFAFIAAAEPGRVAARFFDLVLAKIEGDPVLNIVLRSGELAYLLRKLGPTQVAAGFADDRAFAVEAARLWPICPGTTAVDPDDLLGLMTLTLTLATQSHLMAPELYASTTRLLRDLFVARLEGGRP